MLPTPLSALWQGLQQVLWARRCLLCGEAAASLPAGVACPPCLAALPRNGGCRCAVCDAPLAMLGATCLDCAEALPSSLVGLRAPFVYAGAIAALVRRCKFARRPELAGALGTLMCDDAELVALAGRVDCVVPMPLGDATRQRRGFNQSEVIAWVVARRLRLPLHHGLRRPQAQAPQSRQPRHLRAQNVKGAFVAPPQKARRVLLVDDVVTSTHTMQAAARALKQAGVRAVWAVAAARAIWHM